MLNIVLFGPPGAGKGTQAEFLVRDWDLIHLSTGDLLRSEITASTALGLEAQSFMNKGEFVPDEVVIEMIKNKLQENREVNGFIFDGFPRTVSQAKALDKVLGELGVSVSGMLSLEVEKEELTARLLKRGINSGRPDDQDLAVIENRIQIYEEKTSPLKDYYASQNKHFVIKGGGTIKEIARKLAEVVKSL